MKITSVESQKKNPKRFNVFLDGKFAFGADEDLVVNFRLVSGKEIDSPALEKILFEAEIGKLMDRMYGLFNVRQRSEKEVRDYLRRLSFKRKVADKEELSEVVTEALIQRLKDKTLINDLEFAKAWVEARRRSHKKGIIALKMELAQKGVDRLIIEEVVSDSGDVSEKQLAVSTLEKKISRWKDLEKTVFKRKAIDFLMRKGFEYKIAKEVVDNFTKKS